MAGNSGSHDYGSFPEQEVGSNVHSWLNVEQIILPIAFVVETGFGKGEDSVHTLL